MRSKFAAAGAILYLLAFVCASAYPLFDHSTFAGLPAVLMGLPWIDYIPSSSWLPGAIALNALIIYLVLAAVSLLFSWLRRSLR